MAARELNCTACKTPITGDRYILGDKDDPFLPECFNCAQCGTSLDTDELFVVLTKAGEERKFKHQEGVDLKQGCVEAWRKDLKAKQAAEKEAVVAKEKQAGADAAAAKEKAKADKEAAIKGATGNWKLADLQDPKKCEAAGMPGGEKEKFLSDADFEAAFKMTRDAFNAMPIWKRNNKKKELKIF